MLFPEYICREATDPLEDAGVEVRYYKIRENLVVDSEDLSSHVDSRTKAILAVHYFGFPQPLEELKNACRRYRLPLIEDNAHGFLSSHHGTPLGFSGDAGIVSIRKTLPVRNGALLLLNSPFLQSGDFTGPEIPRISRRLRVYLSLELAVASIGPLFLKATQFLQSLVRAIDKSRMRNGVLPVGREPRTMTPEDGFLQSISAQSWFRLCRTDFAAVVQKRRANYVRLLDWLSDLHECRVVFPSLDEGICPQVFPILVEENDRVISTLQTSGVLADYWPDLPPEVLDNPGRYGRANDLRRHLVTLPIDQSVTIQRRKGVSVSDQTLTGRILAAYGMR